MTEIIQFSLKPGLNMYPVQAGGIKNVVDILPPTPNGWQFGPTLVLAVDPTSPSSECGFTVVSYNQRVDETLTGPLFGHNGSFFIFSPCIAGPYTLNKK